MNTPDRTCDGIREDKSVKNKGLDHRQRCGKPASNRRVQADGSEVWLCGVCVRRFDGTRTIRAKTEKKVVQVGDETFSQMPLFNTNTGKRVRKSAMLMRIINELPYYALWLPSDVDPIPMSLIALQENYPQYARLVSTADHNPGEWIRDNEDLSTQRYG